jgi:hypothetical protein
MDLSPAGILRSFEIAFSSVRHEKTLAGSHMLATCVPSSILVSTVLLPGREADHSSPASAEVNKIWLYTSTPPYAFMA